MAHPYFPYFPSCLNVKGKSCLVVGGDPGAIEKAVRLAQARARVSVFARDLRPSTLQDLRRRKIRRIRRVASTKGEDGNFSAIAQGLKRQFLVVLSKDLKEKFVRRVVRACRRNRVLVCAMDRPEFCDVVNVAVFERGFLKVMISTGGVSPGLARKIREGLERGLKNVPIEEFLKFLARKRGRLRKFELPIMKRREILTKWVGAVNFKANLNIPFRGKNDSSH